MKRCFILLIACVVMVSGCAEPASTVPPGNEVLIDVGHGGFDGGAVAPDGSCEKDYNLAISLCIRDMLAVLGVSVAMTREKDAALADTKSEDMHRRLAMYESASTVISIHQNYFSIPRYDGTQSFYSSGNAGSQPLAEAIQSSVVRHLQPKNKRPVKAVKDGVFLMNTTTSPAVLVECGFLSNQEELSKLKTHHYQQQLSFAIMLGYWDYQCQK